MEPIVKYGILVLWLQSAFFDTLSYCYTWQLKEYRIDRFKDFATTRQGQLRFLGYRFIWRAILALGLYTAFAHSTYLGYVVLTVLFLDLANNVSGIVRRKLVRPKITARSMTIVMVSLIAEGTVLVLTWQLNLILLMLVFRFLITSGIVLVTSIPVQFAKQVIIFLATKKLSKYKKLTVIGITGSYGKTSVKEFTAHILEAKLKVKKTPQNTNTDIGIAIFILRNSFDDIDAFVVEMGAYRMGEIKKICNMTKPSIGIITAIAEQHLSLFGSIENIQKAKFELLESLPEDGFAITNADNQYCASPLDTITAKKRQTFGLGEEQIEHTNNPDFLITDIKTNLKGITWKGTYENIERIVEAPVLGDHQATNMAPALMVAAHMKIGGENAVERCKTLPNNSKTSTNIIEYGVSRVIDDSYNSNPKGFNAALDIMCKFPSTERRVIVTRGMIELGSKSRELHEKIGEEIAFCADELIIITPDNVKPLKDGIDHIKDKYKVEVKLIYDHKKLVKYIQQYKDTPATILLENRIPALLRKEFGMEKSV